MNFIPDDLKQKLLNNGKPENRDQDHAPVVKLFLPGTGCTWLLSELDHEEPDIAFGLCDLAMGFPELGSVLISELESLIIGGVLTVERDISFKPEYPMSVYAYAANFADMITTDKIALDKASEELKRQRERNDLKL